eukprot:NODE_480_length_6952_cov_0.771487.p5 type:complete len:157 gc:universal NODE_480_length_6952_cov_0.771487:3180-3650(+)
MLLPVLLACDYKMPQGLSEGQEFNIQPVASYLPNSSQKITVSGIFIIQDACTVVIKDLVYTPQIQQVYLYSSNTANINDSSALGEQISAKEIQHSAFKGTVQNITLTKPIDNAKSLKLFGSQDNFVLAGASISSCGGDFSTLSIALVTLLLGGSLQ